MLPAPGIWADHTQSGPVPPCPPLRPPAHPQAPLGSLPPRPQQVLGAPQPSILDGVLPFWGQGGPLLSPFRGTRMRQTGFLSAPGLCCSLAAPTNLSFPNSLSKAFIVLPSPGRGHLRQVAGRGQCQVGWMLGPGGRGGQPTAARLWSASALNWSWRRLGGLGLHPGRRADGSCSVPYKSTQGPPTPGLSPSHTRGLLPLREV